MITANESDKYRLMPFSFERLESGEYFLSSLGGDFAFLNADDFENFITGSLSRKSMVFLALESKKLLTTGSSAARLMTASELLSRKAFTFSGPRLHIVVVTRACNSHCDYCHASSYNPGDIAPFMSLKTATAVAKSILSSPSQDLTVEFQGGEPTLAWDAVRFMVEYITILNIKYHKNITFVLCTNLLYLTEEMIKYIDTWKIEVSTSLDGPAEFHDLHRHCPQGSAHAVFLKNLDRLETRTKRKASPLLTVTHQNLHHLRSIIDHYVEIERNGIFIRPLNPFGRAIHDESMGYSLDEFTEAYLDALAYIININKSGRDFREFMATLFLRRMLTCYDDGFVDLKFPAGAALSVLVYDVNGDVYPSDEARMMAAAGDLRLRMGNVQTMSGNEIRKSPIVKAIFDASLPFLIPGCTTCPYALYCGVDPVRCFSETGDFMLRTESAECRKNRKILRWLFHALRYADLKTEKILYGWIL